MKVHLVTILRCWVLHSCSYWLSTGIHNLWFSWVWFSAHTPSFEWTFFYFCVYQGLYQKSVLDSEQQSAVSSHWTNFKTWRLVTQPHNLSTTHSLRTVVAWRPASFCPVFVAVIAYTAHLRMFHMIDCWRTANHILSKHYVRFKWRLLPS